MNHVCPAMKASQSNKPPRNTIQNRKTWDPPKPLKNSLTIQTRLASGIQPERKKLAITCVPAHLSLGDFLSHNQLAIGLLRRGIGSLVCSFLLVQSIFNPFRGNS